MLREYRPLGRGPAASGKQRRPFSRTCGRPNLGEFACPSLTSNCALSASNIVADGRGFVATQWLV